MSEIERIVTSQTTTGTSSSTTSGASSASKSDNTIFAGTKKKDLTQEEIKLLKSLGIDPNDTAAVEQWRALPQEQRTAQLNQYYMQSEADKGTAPQTPQNTTPQPSASSPVTPEADVSAQSPATPASAPTTPAATTQTSQQATTQTAAPTAPATGAQATSAEQPDGTTAPSIQTLPAAATPTTPASAQTTADTPDAATQSAAPQTQGAAAKMPTPVNPDLLIADSSEAISSSLAAKVDMSPINIDKIEISFMDVLRGISQDQWESYPKEERLHLLMQGVGDQFKDELKDLDSEQRHDVIMGLIDKDIMKEQGYSQEKWDSFSDKKKQELRLKYGTTFTLAIEKGFQAEDIDNLSIYQVYKQEIDIYEEKKSSFLQKVEEGSIDKKTADRMIAKAESMMAEKIEMIDMAEKLAQYNKSNMASQSVSEAVESAVAGGATGNAAVTDAVAGAVNGAVEAKKTSYIDKFEQESGLKMSDIKYGNVDAKTKYIETLSEKFDAELNDKTKEERAAFYRQLIQEAGEDTNELMLIQLAIKETKKGPKNYTEFSNAINQDVKSGKIERKKAKEIADSMIAVTDSNKDSVESMADVAEINVITGNVEGSEEHKDKMRYSKQNLNPVLSIYGEASKKIPEFGRGLGVVIQTSKNRETQVDGMKILAKAELGSEITTAMKPADGEKPDGELQIAKAKAVVEANPKSFKANQGLKDATPFIAKDAASEYFEIGFKATENLEGKDVQIEAQKGWNDIIPECDASVQGDMFKTTMTSKYDEVLEYASSNIYKLDESVQSEAIQITYETGNQKAIDAANAQLDKCDAKAVEAVGEDVVARETRATETRYAQEVAEQVAEFNQKYQELTGTSAQENLLPDADEQKIAFVENFLHATPQEQYKLLSKIPQAWQGTVFSKICQYCPNLLTGLVKQGYGKQILKTPGMPSDVIYKVINTMLTCGTKDKNDAAKYVVDHKALFTESTLERCEEILEGTKRNMNYTSAPMGGGVQSALQPSMSAIYPDRKSMFFKA